MKENHNSASKIQQYPMPAPELDQLNIFVGNWHTEGDWYCEEQPEEEPYASALKWSSEENYEWMSGGYFLVHRWNAKVGGSHLKGIEIIGYDVAKNEYFSRFSDNSGNVVKYTISLKNDAWFFTEPHTRLNIVFSDNGNSMTSNWEWKHEGGDWLPLSSRKAVRTGR